MSPEVSASLFRIVVSNVRIHVRARTHGRAFLLTSSAEKIALKIERISLFGFSSNRELRISVQNHVAVHWPKG